MPWASTAQAAWGHSPEGMQALGGPEKVKEWDQASEGLALPERTAKSRLQGASPKARHRLNLKTRRNWMKG